MKKINCLLLACLLIVSCFTCNSFAALPETIEPQWDNTFDVALSHGAVGTTAHCYVDFSVRSGATVMNTSIRLIAMDERPQRVVAEWDDSALTLDAPNMYSFYGTVPNIVPGNGYQLVFQCEVWRNGVCDYISQACDAIY